MSRRDGRLGRREFLCQATQSAAVVAASAGMASACRAGAADRSAADTIPIRTLGKTGLNLPVLGFGGAALPAAWGNPLSRERRVDLVRYAYERGIRYFDTAGASYMESQAILGEGLKHKRRDVCLVTKVDTTQPDEVRKSVEQSLKELQTDYLDIVLIHGTPGLQQMTVAEAMAVHAELDKLRNQKMTRFIGFSAHGYFDRALALISSGGFDQCMLSYGYIPRGYDQVWSSRTTELRNACLAKAHETGMGIVAMKVVGAGMLGAWSGYIVPGYDRERLARLPGAAIRWTLQDERVDILNIGMRLKPEIDANVDTITGTTTFTSEDRALLAEFSARLYDTDAMKKLKIE